MDSEEVIWYSFVFFIVFLLMFFVVDVCKGDCFFGEPLIGIRVNLRLL